MKKSFTAVLIVILAITGYSQKFEYFDTDSQPTDSLNCYYYYKKSMAGLLSLGTDTITSFYCANNRVRTIQIYKDGKREGPSYHYYLNGQLMEKVNYKDNVANGIVTQFYQNGKAKFTKLFLSPAQIEPNILFPYLIVNSWDSLGNPMVKNMKGFFKDERDEGKIENGLRDSVWKSYDGKGKTILIEKFSMGVFIEGDRIEDGSKIHYEKFEVSASPKGGMISFYNHVGRELRYPSKARRVGTEGNVFVEFVVERDGSLTNVKVVRGIGGGCDEEAVRVVEKAPAWEPGYQRAKPVRQKMVISINFRLG